AGTIRHGARALAAVYQASVPWVSIIVRKVFGVAGAAMGHAQKLNLRYAWPSGDWGSLPLEGGIEAAYRRVLEEADDPDAKRQEIPETRGGCCASGSVTRTASSRRSSAPGRMACGHDRMSIEVRPFGPDDRGWAYELLFPHGTESRVASKGTLYDPLALPGFVAWEDEERTGLVVYRPEAWEILTLASVRDDTGAGTALIDAVKDEARA